MSPDFSIATTDETADPKILVDRVKTAISDLSDYHQRLRSAHEVAYCLWSGQSPDGRKHASRIGREPFPWENASDARVKLAEEVVIEITNRQLAAFARGNMQAVAKDHASLQASGLATQLLTYVMRVQMAPELRSEMELAATWRNTYGLSIVHVDWQKQTRMEPVTITMEQIADMALQAAAATPQGQQLAQSGDAQGLGALAMTSVQETISALADPAQEDTLVTELKAQAPWLSRRQARAVIRELRETGASTYPAPRVAVSRPFWRALRPQVDVFFPRETRHLSEAAWVALPIDLTLDQLRDREHTDGWDPAFIEAVEKRTKGHTVFNLIDGYTDDLRSAIATGSYRSYATTADDHEDLYQVLAVYYRATDAKGFPGVYRAIIHPDVSGLVGRDGLAPCAHGQFPFVAFPRERIVPALIESRGIPEVAETDQEAAKVQRDFRTDRTELQSLPPLIASANRGGGRYPIQPGAQVPSRPNSEMRFMDLPKMDTASMEIEAALRADVARYFGRSHPEVDPATSLTMQQKQVDDFLADVGACVRLTWADLQQYMEPTVIARVLGAGASAAPIAVTREDIQGGYDFHLRFDVVNLDMESLSKRLDAWSSFVLGADTLSVVDRAQYVNLAARAIDPTGADLVLRDPAEAEASEIEDEKAALAKISAGVEPLMIEGQNHAARLQALQQAVQVNPQLMRRYQEDEIFRALVDARVQHHQHQIEQQQNAVIGRMGAAQVLPVG